MIILINSFKITNINIDKLNKKIDEFQVSNQLSPYIFMNSDTIEELIKIAGYNPDKVWGVMELIKDIKYFVMKKKVLEKLN